MFLRLFLFWLGLALAVVLDANWTGPWYATATFGVLIGVLGFWQSWRGSRVLLWLKKEGQSEAPPVNGLWGEVSDRVRRLLRQRELQAAASEARLQEFLAALQASPNGVVLLDAQGHIEWCNQMAAEHFGFEVPRDLQQSLGNLLRDPVFTDYETAGDYRTAVTLLGRGNTPSHPVKISLQLHPYGDGRKLLLSRDITALEQAEAMRRDFVANVSHEIRTPLTVLVGFIETLQTLPLNEDERTRYLALMAQQSARMQSVVQDLLTLSRLEGSPTPDLHEWTSVAALLQHCQAEAAALSAQLYPDAAAPQQLSFPSMAAQRAAGEIAGRGTELQSALSNLVNNAVRYTPAGGRITVEWQPLPDGSARFSVRDTGAGIAPEHLPRLTERFYRIDRSRSRETGGTGLGLAIVKHALQRHGAALEISSELGQGSVFATVFPAQRLRLPSELAQLEAASEGF